MFSFEEGNRTWVSGSRSKCANHCATLSPSLPQPELTFEIRFSREHPLLRELRRLWRLCRDPEGQLRHPGLELQPDVTGLEQEPELPIMLQNNFWQGNFSFGELCKYPLKVSQIEVPKQALSKKRNLILIKIKLSSTIIDQQGWA